MTYRVELSEAAIADLDDLHAWIEDRAGFDVADGYQARVRRRIAALADYPGRGTPRDDLGKHVRKLGFERRLLILYLIEPDRVYVLRVVDAAQQAGPISVAGLRS